MIRWPQIGVVKKYWDLFVSDVSAPVAYTLLVGFFIGALACAYTLLISKPEQDMKALERLFDEKELVRNPDHLGDSPP